MKVCQNPREISSPPKSTSSYLKQEVSNLSLFGDHFGLFRNKGSNNTIISSVFHDFEGDYIHCATDLPVIVVDYKVPVGS